MPLIQEPAGAFHERRVAPAHQIEEGKIFMELTKQDILSMTNIQKRKDFLDTWATWTVWVDVPELGMTVRAVTLPDGSRITATRFAQHCSLYEHANMCRLRAGEGYSSQTTCRSELVEHLTQLRNEYAHSDLIDYLKRLPRKHAAEDTQN